MLRLLVLQDPNVIAPEVVGALRADFIVVDVHDMTGAIERIDTQAPFDVLVGDLDAQCAEGVMLVDGLAAIGHDLARRCVLVALEPMFAAVFFGHLAPRVLPRTFTIGELRSAIVAVGLRRQDR